MHNKFVVNLLMILTVGLNASSTLANSTKLANEIPIADLHFHPEAKMSPSKIMQVMDDNNVQWAGLGVKLGKFKLWKKYSDEMDGRFIPFAGQREFQVAFFKGGSSAMVDLDNPILSKFIRQVEGELETGKIKGIGELFINKNSKKQRKHNRKVKADAPIFRDLYQLLAKHGAFLAFHMEGDSDSMGQMESLLESDRNGRIIWNHCGTNTSSSDVRKLLERNSNLFCELSKRYLVKGNQRNIFSKSQVDSDWLELIEDFSDRFMIGTDAHSIKQYHQYIKVVREGLLSRLSPSTIRKVAYENAQHLFNLQW
jgi:hypothetical protein